MATKKSNIIPLRIPNYQIDQLYQYGSPYRLSPGKLSKKILLMAVKNWNSFLSQDFVWKEFTTKMWKEWAVLFIDINGEVIYFFFDRLAWANALRTVLSASVAFMPLQSSHAMI